MSAGCRRLTGMLGQYGGGAKAPPELRARVLAAIAGEERKAAGETSPDHRIRVTCSVIAPTLCISGVASKRPEHRRRSQEVASANRPTREVKR